MQTQPPHPSPQSINQPLYCVTFTPAQIKTLLGFLQRASLTGREVPAYTELLTLITRPTPHPPNPPAHPSSLNPQPPSSLPT